MHDKTIKKQSQEIDKNFFASKNYKKRYKIRKFKTTFLAPLLTRLNNFYVNDQICKIVFFHKKSQKTRELVAIFFAPKIYLRDLITFIYNIGKTKKQTKIKKFTTTFLPPKS